MKLPIGQSDFKKIVEGGFKLIDKSLLIPEILKEAEVILITRPRRFGKTLNMSMLRYFFAKDVHGQPTQNLFNNLKVAQAGDIIQQHQGKYPVIFLSFKDIKESSFELAYDKIYETLIALYDEFSYLQESSALSEHQKDFFKQILKREANQAQLENSLQMLSLCLFKHHGEKVIILIDEYDTPIQSGYLKDYYERTIALFRNFFGAALKDNPHLFKAVLTGILRISRESLFSGLNNLKVYSVLHPQFGSFFGFTETEVAELLDKAQLQNKASELKHWYNGYHFGNTVLYNPWSIVNCIQDGGSFKTFWINTSDNELIKSLLLKSSADFKHRLEILLEGSPIERLIDENVVFPDLKKNTDSAIWSFLVMTGYLKIGTHEDTNRGSLCQLAIPNQEIRNLYQTIIESWLANGRGLEWYTEFLNNLLTGKMEAFKRDLQHIMEHTVSAHDVGKEPEAFYHGLMIGLTASLSKQENYEIKSNRESGYGRYDYVILSRDPEKLSLILEFKQATLSQTKANNTEIESLLKTLAQEALQQIDQRAYATELKQRGITKILKIGIAFNAKHFGLAYVNEVQPV